MALHRLIACALLLLFAGILTPFPSSAQNQPAPAAASSEQLLKPEQLDALVAPIALYPDNLLSLVLMASTYPLEVVVADRWVKENKKLKGEKLKAVVNKQAWDDNVKSLVATPDVLSMMSTKIDWTQKLGDAVLAQQPDVMDAIQRLRAKAEANNKLTSTKQQKVTKAQQAGKEVIIIEPTDPGTVYVPYYDPAVVYGSWPYAAYPPYYFGCPGYIPCGLIGAGLAFGAGWALANWGSGGNYWGGGFNWNNNNINFNRPRLNPLNGSNWQHRPEHRQGVRYNNPRVEQRFGNNSIRNGAQGRNDFRGRGERPGAGKPPSGGRPNAGQRPNGGRPSAGQRPSGGRPNAGQRPSGGRPSAGQRPSGARPNAGRRPSGGGAYGNIGSGRAANRSSARGRQSMGGRGGGGARAGGGGRGGGGGGGRGGGGGGRRSDIRLKHDIAFLGRLDDGLGFYRFTYNGGHTAYVGVMAQEVRAVMPAAVAQGSDGYLRVYYDKLGLTFQTYGNWIASGARLPATIPITH